MCPTLDADEMLAGRYRRGALIGAERHASAAELYEDLRDVCSELVPAALH